MTLASVALVPAYNPGSWRTYFTLTGTAAATLTGLFFVGFSLRVGELQLSPVLRTRARYLLLWLVAITVGSGFVVMPGQPRALLATEILVVTVSGVTYTVWAVLRMARPKRAEMSANLAVRWLGTVATWLLSIGAGISLLAGWSGGLNLFAFALLLGIALQVAAAWTLVAETGKHTGGNDAPAGGAYQAEPPSAGRPAHTEDASRAVPDQ